MFGLAVGLEALANCMDGIRGHCWNHCTGLRETIRPTNQAHHQTLGLQLARQAQAWTGCSEALLGKLQGLPDGKKNLYFGKLHPVVWNRLQTSC